MKQQGRVLFFIALAAGVALAATVSGLGGGGLGGASAKPSVALTVARDKAKKTSSCKKNCAPTVVMSVSPAKVRAGQTATLTWSATGATSCTASDAWSGSQAVSGSLPVTPTSGGRVTYTLACSSGSATTYASAVLMVPIPVLPSSYENRMAAGDPSRGKGVPPVGAGGASYSPIANVAQVAWADFFQEGEYSLVVNSLERDAPNIVPNLPGHFYFFKYRNGRYENHTAELLKDTTACLGQGNWLLIADFNGDGSPDVYEICYGIDTPDGVAEQDRLLLSQPDGTYANTVVPGLGKHHGATAADLNGDGLPDVLTTDSPRSSDVGAKLRPRVLINNGDGTFHAEPQRLPDFLVGKSSLVTFELLDTGRGVRDLFVGSNVCGQESTRAPTDCPANWLPSALLILNDGHGNFANSQVINLPNPPGQGGIIYGPTLEFYFLGGYLYWLQYSGYWDATTPPNGAMTLNRLNLDTQDFKRVYEHRGPFFPDEPDLYIPHLVPWGDGTLHPLCGKDHAMQVYGICTLSFPM